MGKLDSSYIEILVYNFWCFVNSIPLLLEVSLFSFQGIYAKTKKVLHKIIELAFHFMSPLFFKLPCDESHVLLFFLFSWICEFLNKKKEKKISFVLSIFLSGTTSSGMVLVLVHKSRLLNPFVFKSSRYKVGTKQQKKAGG